MYSMKKLLGTSLSIALLSVVTTGIVHAQDDDSVEVNVAIANDIDGLDPYTAQSTLTSSVLENVFGGLLTADTDGSLVPNLAHSYEISEDSLTYTFFLEEDVMFHDGSDFTADDVVYSYSKLAGLDGEEPLSDKWEVVSDVVAVDDYTVEVVLETPDIGFLARTINPITPDGYEDHATAPVGTGPYKFETHQVDQRVTLVKNDDYFKGNDFDVDVVNFVVMPDSETAILAFQAGEIDIISYLSEQYLSRLNDDVEVVTGPMNMVMMMAFNHELEVFEDENVRKAMNKAINKQEIIDIALDGSGTELHTFMSPAMDYYYNADTEGVNAYDVEAARELMEQSEHPDGFELTLSVPNNSAIYTDAAQVLAAQLAEINVQLDLNVIEFSTWLETVYNERDYESTIIGFTGKLDPYDVMIRMVSDYHYNFMNYDNEDYDAAIENAVGSASEEEARDYYFEAQEIVTDEAAVVFLMDPDRKVVLRDGISGFESYPYERYVIKDLTVE